MDERESMKDSSEKSDSDQLQESRDADSLPSGTGTSQDINSGSAKEKASSDVAQSGASGFHFPPEELPTLQWSDVESELNDSAAREWTQAQDSANDDLEQQATQSDEGMKGIEDAMTWLEKLAAGQGMPIDEMPTLVTVESVERSQNLAEYPADSGTDSSSESSALELDSDPMAWLEQLAVDQSSPLEELPSVADRLLASDIESQVGILSVTVTPDPADIDRALSYLENLAADQDIDLSKVTFDPKQPPDSIDDALVIIDGIAVLSSPEDDESEALDAITDDDLAGEVEDYDQRVGVSATMPEDPHEALDWLSDMGEESAESSLDVIEEADTIVPQGDSPKNQEEVESTPDISELVLEEEISKEPDVDSAALQEMPDDPDEAMAWMQDLAEKSNRITIPEQSQDSLSERESRPVVESASEKAATILEAQEALENGDSDKAQTLFQMLLDNEGVDDDLIAALEKAAGSPESTPQIHRLLGDAYMETDQVDKAISAFRKGFDRL